MCRKDISCLQLQLTPGPALQGMRHWGWHALTWQQVVAALWLARCYLQLCTSCFLKHFFFNLPVAFHLLDPSQAFVALISSHSLLSLFCLCAFSSPFFSISGVHIVPALTDIKEMQRIRCPFRNMITLLVSLFNIHISPGWRQSWGEGAPLHYWQWLCAAKFQPSWLLGFSSRFYRLIPWCYEKLQLFVLYIQWLLILFLLRVLQKCCSYFVMQFWCPFPDNLLSLPSFQSKWLQ